MERKVTIIPPVDQTTDQNMGDEKKRRVAAYCRVSTDAEKQLASYENQVEYYTKMIKRNPEYKLVDVYADEGISGTSTKKRDEFNRMIEDCFKGKIDLIITKSISRFSRNTLDCLNYIRILKGLDVEVRFEKENIDSLSANGEVLLTILSSLAQDESRNISENTTWGIRRLFEQGEYRITTKRFIGYDMGEDGRLKVNMGQAKTVIRLFEEYLAGRTTGYIAKLFRDERVTSWDGKYDWYPSTLNSMLQNEKYVGDAVCQKTYTVDYLSNQRTVNLGKLPKYYIENDHKPIVSLDIWEAAQEERERRRKYCEEHFMKGYAVNQHKNPFSGKVICGNCGRIYTRLSYRKSDGGKSYKWRCITKLRENQKSSCQNCYVQEDALERLFIVTWNQIIDTASEYQAEWERILAGDSKLQSYKIKIMMEYVQAGRIADFNIDHMLCVVDHITVMANGDLKIQYYGGQVFEVSTRSDNEIPVKARNRQVRRRMTSQEKENIRLLREYKVGYEEISQKLDIPYTTIQRFCLREGIGLGPEDMKYQFCQYCGKKLDVSKYRSNKMFCDRSCQRKKQEKIGKQLEVITVTCAYCGKQFEGLSNRKYCSQFCSIRQKSKTPSKEASLEKSKITFIKADGEWNIRF